MYKIADSDYNRCCTTNLPNSPWVAQFAQPMCRNQSSHALTHELYLAYTSKIHLSIRLMADWQTDETGAGPLHIPH